MPPTKVSTRGNIKWVVLEEPEMGLHPRAISVVLLMIFELVVRGYRVCVSTHSPHVLEAIWALRQLRENNGSPADLLDAFEATNTQTMRKLAQSMMEKDVKVFYFDREKGTTKDISILDPAGEEVGESGWGGLTEFSGRVNTVVARTVANS
jgi:predicted ATPase